MKVKLYAQTGFNAVDIPDSIKIIEDNFIPLKTETNIGIIQNDYIAQITVGDIEHYEARKIDYVIIEDDDTPLNNNKTCYTVESFEMVAPEVCKFTLLIDAYNTIGGFKADSGNLIVAGSANRMSVSLAEDNSQFFILPEPFKPSGKIKITTSDLNKPNSSDTIVRLVETLTIPPKTVAGKIKAGAENITAYDSDNSHVYMGHSTGQYIMKQQSQTPAGNIENITVGQVISPKSRKIKHTAYKITKIDGTSITIDLGTRWWVETENSLEYEKTLVDGTVVSGDLIQDFRDNGKDQDIISYWEIPRNFIVLPLTIPKYDPIEETNYGGLDTAEDVLHISSLTITPITAYNNKARYSQNISVKVVSPVSANQLDKKLYEIINPATTPAQTSYVSDFAIGADIRPSGSPYFLWKYINGEQQVKNKTYEIINGGTWRDIPLVATGVSNKNYENARVNQQANVAKYGDIMSMILGVVGVGVGVATMGAGTALGSGISAIGTSLGARSLVGGIKGFAEHSYNQAEQQRLLDVQGEQASAQLTIGNSTYLREVGDNYFVAVIAQYNEVDTMAYDTFLTKYGYNVGNKPITNADFYSRPAFNYMRINDITIESVNAGINMINMVKQQLQAGVRIWHKKPTPQDMVAGGNR